MVIAQHNAQSISRQYWLKGMPQQIATGLCGIIAVIVAIKAAAYDPGAGEAPALFDHFVRILSFAALTVWATFAIGIRRRGAAAMITLTFAVFVELVLAPVQHDGLSTIASANLGIVLAYCSMHLYWLTLEQQTADDQLQVSPSKD